MHNTCIKHGRNIRTRYVGSTSILRYGKDWSSIRLDRTLPFFTKHFQLIVFRKLLGWKAGEVIFEKVYASPRPPKISLKHDWKRELGSEHAQRPEGQVVQPSRSFQSNQPIPNPDHDRMGQIFVGSDPRTARKVEGERPVPRRSKHVLVIKKLLNMIERGNPLSAVTQVTSQVTSNRCWTRWTLTSKYLDCHILLWNKLRTLVFVNWSRRWRTTLTDMLFNAICNRTKPTTRSVRRQSKWFTTWAR